MAAAEITPSGVPPIPHSRSTGEFSLTASSEAETSPSVIRRTRAPASRTWCMASWWRSRSSITTITSRMSRFLRSAISASVSASGRSRSSRSAMSGPPAIFSMYTHGPGSNIVPRSDSAITASALGIPSAVSRVPSSGSTAMSTWGGLPSPMCSPLKSIGASSFSPSPITTTPSIETESSTSAWRRRRPGRRPPCRRGRPSARLPAPPPR